MIFLNMQTNLIISVQVLDVVRAAELLASQGTDSLPKPKSPGGPMSGGGDTLKTTTIVMSGHTLAPQNSVSHHPLYIGFCA